MSDLQPYWTSPDGRITVYHSKWEAVRGAGLLPVREVALVHADVPYGIDEPTDRRGRSSPTSKWHRNTVFPRIQGDDKPYDPAPLLSLNRPSVLWGANHYASRLPDSAAWISWDKRDGERSNTNSDIELAWTNIGGSARTFRHLWMGLCRASEAGETPLGPTQKPVWLSAKVFRFAKLKPGDLVFVPYLGSGPDLPAAVAMGLKIIACDVEQWCCDTAISRLRAITPAKAAEPVGPLFGGAS